MCPTTSDKITEDADVNGIVNNRLEVSLVSRQFDLKAEERTTTRNNAVIKALYFDLQGVIEFQGGKMRGFAMNYKTFQCTMVWKAVFEGKQKVAFITAETPIDCILTAMNLARHNELRWKVDVYAPKET